MKLVILAAGFGSRLWPLSTSDHPKQFQRILGDQTLIQYTYDLLSRAAGQENVYILTLQGLEHLALEQVPALDSEHLVTVPLRRNTLPHAIVALRQLVTSDDEFVHFFSVDHVLDDPEAYSDGVREYLRRENELDPRHIYIHCNPTDKYPQNEGYLHLEQDGHVAQYIEKPDTQTLAALIEKDTTYKYEVACSITKLSLGIAIRDLDSPLK